MTKTNIVKKCKSVSHVMTRDEIRNYCNISTARKLEWLEEMRTLFFAAMTPALFKRWEKLRQKGY